MRKLRKLRQLARLLWLPAPDRQLVFLTLLLMSMIRFGLWLVPFRLLLRFLKGISQRSPENKAQNTVSIEKIVWAVELSSRFMPGGVKCLARALTTKVLLDWYWYTPDLRIGVAKSDSGQLEAHAWIENQGQVIIGNLADLSRFTPLPSLEGIKL